MTCKKELETLKQTTIKEFQNSTVKLGLFIKLEQLTVAVSYLIARKQYLITKKKSIKEEGTSDA